MNINKTITLALLASSILLSAGNSNARDFSTIRIDRPVLNNLRPINTCLFMPDLVVKYQRTTWNASNHSAQITIKNVGLKSSGAFMLYVTPGENPVSSNHRPQMRYNINNLGPGEARSMVADFDALAHPDNNMLGNVVRVTTHIDPKNQVRECKENNNTWTNRIL